MRRRIPLAIACLGCALVLLPVAPARAANGPDAVALPTSVASDGARESTLPGDAAGAPVGLWERVLDGVRLFVYMIAR